MGAGPMLALGNSELAGVEELLSLWINFIIYNLWKPRNRWEEK
jgi:hypothetical protein